MEFQGIYADIPTPFDHKQDLYLPKIAFNVARWNQTALSGYLVGSRAGEGAKLTFQEKVVLWKEVSIAAATDKTLLAAVGAVGVREALELTGHVASLGYRAVLVTPGCAPGGRPPSEAERVQYVTAVAEQSDLPVILDNPWPGKAVRLTAAEARSVSEHRNVIAVLEAGPPSRSAGDGPSGTAAFQRLTASASGLDRNLCEGANAAVIPFASVAPFYCLSIDEAVRTRAFEAAAALTARAERAISAIGEQLGAVAIKTALDLQGYYGGPPRMPYRALTGAERTELEEALQGIRS